MTTTFTQDTESNGVASTQEPVAEQAPAPSRKRSRAVRSSRSHGEGASVGGSDLSQLKAQMAYLDAKRAELHEMAVSKAKERRDELLAELATVEAILGVKKETQEPMASRPVAARKQKGNRRPSMWRSTSLDIDKSISQIVSAVGRTPMTSEQIQAKTGLSRRDAAKALKLGVARGVLRANGAARGRKYTAT